MKYRAVLFDIFGTLVVIEDMEAELDTWLGRFYDCLKPHGLDIPRESFNEWCLHHIRQEPPPPGKEDFTIFERRIQAVFSNARLQVNPADIRQTSVTLLKVWNDYAVIDPDCHPLLRELSQQYTLGVISNYDHPPYIRRVLNDLNLKKYFSTVVISGDYDFKKPDPRIFHLALEKLGLKPEDAVYLGDAEEDVVGARAAGIVPILIQRETTATPPDIIKRDYTQTDVLTINRLPELLNLLD
jgi:putative hydrolase of the HAD superfamily